MKPALWDRLPVWERLVTLMVGEAGDTAAVSVDQVDLRIAVLAQHHRQAPAVGRPRRRAVAAAEIGNQRPRARRQRSRCDKHRVEFPFGRLTDGFAACKIRS